MFYVLIACQELLWEENTILDLADTDDQKSGPAAESHSVLYSDKHKGMGGQDWSASWRTDGMDSVTTSKTCWIVGMPKKNQLTAWTFKFVLQKAKVNSGPQSQTCVLLCSYRPLFICAVSHRRRASLSPPWLLKPRHSRKTLAGCFHLSLNTLYTLIIWLFSSHWSK